MQKQVSRTGSRLATPPSSGELDAAGIATALGSSEADGHPIENAFDAQRGPGGSRWEAGGNGEQTLILHFDTPLTIGRAALDVEENEASRIQGFNLAPPGHNLRARGMGAQRGGDHPFESPDHAGQGRASVPREHHLAGIAVNPGIAAMKQFVGRKPNSLTRRENFDA
jgi:hypothetical protein